MAIQGQHDQASYLIKSEMMGKMNFEFDPKFFKVDKQLGSAGEAKFKLIVIKEEVEKHIQFLSEEDKRHRELLSKAEELNILE